MRRALTATLTLTAAGTLAAALFGAGTAIAEPTCDPPGLHIAILNATDAGNTDLVTHLTGVQASILLHRNCPPAS